MSPIRRIYRRVTTTERIIIPPEGLTGRLVNGDTFRVEIFKKDGSEEELVYEREHTGSVEVEELDNGKFILTGDVFPDKRSPRD
ncbi:MAG: hypothetical protein KA746_14340 [Pyrinomonadaceae bacterium]|nr:hypothetical protein [Pyrinomonadaceae bacterium]MBP6212533.1 hypothetical protein [Pyrinomonadaceae bacterium]